MQNTSRTIELSSDALVRMQERALRRRREMSKAGSAARPRHHAQTGEEALSGRHHAVHAQLHKRQMTQTRRWLLLLPLGLGALGFIAALVFIAQNVTGP